MTTTSENDPMVQYTFQDKFKSGVKWLIRPCEQICSPSTAQPASTTSPHGLSSRRLKPTLNRVNGLVKYFAFGVMFTNGM